MTLYWPTKEALELLHGLNLCAECGGRAWVAVEDPLYPGSYIDSRCPSCARNKAPGVRQHTEGSSLLNHQTTKG